MSPQSAPGAKSDKRLLALARTLLAARRGRDRFMPDAAFSDPAWDMLLDLFVAHHEGRGVSVSSLCIAAYVPQTTALRWVTALAKKGYLIRRADSEDRRVVRIDLTEVGRTRMELCLAYTARLFDGTAGDHAPRPAGPRQWAPGGFAN